MLPQEMQQKLLQVYLTGAILFIFVFVFSVLTPKCDNFFQTKFDNVKVPKCDNFFQANFDNVKVPKCDNFFQANFGNAKFRKRSLGSNFVNRCFQNPGIF